MILFFRYPFPFMYVTLVFILYTSYISTEFSKPFDRTNTIPSLVTAQLQNPPTHQFTPWMDGLKAPKRPHTPSALSLVNLFVDLCVLFGGLFKPWTNLPLCFCLPNFQDWCSDHRWQKRGPVHLIRRGKWGLLAANPFVFVWTPPLLCCQISAKVGDIWIWFGNLSPTSSLQLTPILQ